MSFMVTVSVLMLCLDILGLTDIHIAICLMPAVFGFGFSFGKAYKTTEYKVVLDEIERNRKFEDDLK